MAATEAVYVDALPAELQTSHSWEDPDRWELGPVSPGEEPFEPHTADRDWWAKQSLRPITSEPADRDWGEYARWSE
jgi:hypothetical protein